MLQKALAQLRAAYSALTATPRAALHGRVEPPSIREQEPDQAAPKRAGRQAIPYDPVLRALTIKPNATVSDWRQWYEAHDYGDIPMTRGQVLDVIAMICKDLQCSKLNEDDVIGPRGMFRPVHQGINESHTIYRYRPAEADDAGELDATAKRLLAFLATRARPVSGKLAARAMGVHHSSISRAKDRLVKQGLIVEERMGREVMLSVPRRKDQAARKYA